MRRPAPPSPRKGSQSPVISSKDSKSTIPSDGEFGERIVPSPQQEEGPDAAAEVPMGASGGQAMKATGGVEDQMVVGSVAVTKASSAKVVIRSSSPGRSYWQGMRGEWWMQSEPTRPILRGVDFSLDTQEDGEDEVYFVPDSDDEGYHDRRKFEVSGDEVVPDSELPEAPAMVGNCGSPIAVQENHRQRHPRQPLGLMMKEWRRALFPDDNPGAGQTVAESEINHESKTELSKDCAKKEISISDAETDDEGVGVEVKLPQGESETKQDRTSEDEETDAKGDSVRVDLPVDETIIDLVSLFVPAYKQVSKRRRT